MGALRRPLLAGAQVRGFAHPRKINMIDSEFNAPSSEKTLYKNDFINKPAAEHQKDMETAKKTISANITDTSQLMPSHAGDPHQTYGVAEWRHIHYEVTREPTFPRQPDLAKGELASGAQVSRTDVWMDSKEPAITSVAKFSPENWRPAGWAENAPMPTTTCPEGTLDFRVNRLPLEHADRRPWIYFVSASTGFITAALVRGVVCKLIHTMWPAKDVFAAGIVEIDIRPIRVGQNFVGKWRSKPIFVRRRTPEMIEAAVRDDAIAGSFRHPQSDKDRVQNPEYLVVIGVCTHLGCIPSPDQGNWGGYFCPCHGSHYDHSGRIRLGPAPENLEVPPYMYPDEHTLRLG